MLSKALSLKLIRESNMDRRTTYLVLFTLSLTSGIAGLPATTSAAEGPIGVTAVVRNTVSQLEPQVTKVAKGDEVVRNEVVRTAADSDAKFVLRDDTNLMLGPSSTLKLDRTVFDDPKAGDIAIKLTSGAFRFVTGHSNKEAYEIKTPIATLGVRGTMFDVRVIPRQRNTIFLVKGEVTVCTPDGKKCHLLHENESLDVFPNGTMESKNGPPDWTFERSADSVVWGTSTFAEAGGNDVNTASLGTGGGGTGGPTGPAGPSGGGGGAGGGGGGSAGGGGGSGGGGGGGGGAGGGGGSSGGGALAGAPQSGGGLTGTSTSASTTPINCPISTICPPQ
jgi:FecR protein